MMHSNQPLNNNSINPEITEVIEITTTMEIVVKEGILVTTEISTILLLMTHRQSDVENVAYEIAVGVHADVGSVRKNQTSVDVHINNVTIARMIYSRACVTYAKHVLHPLP